MYSLCTVLYVSSTLAVDVTTESYSQRLDWPDFVFWLCT